MIMEDAKIVRKTSYCLEILYDKWINVYWFTFVIVGIIITMLLGLIYYT